MSVPSVHIAKDRLRNLLIADRLMCTPDMSERMTSDIYYTTLYKNGSSMRTAVSSLYFPLIPELINLVILS